MTRKKPNRIEALTGLRFCFALAVFGHHCHFLTQGGDAQLAAFYQRYLYEGYIGVSFFFVLSGFILAYVYQVPLRERSVSRRSFYLARFARVYPLHLLTLLLALPISRAQLLGVPVETAALKLSTQLSLTQSWVPRADVYGALNAPAWSISDEAFFYLVFPGLVVWLAGGLRRTPGWVYGGVAALVVGVILLMFVVPEDLQHAVFYINPGLRLVDFLLGILLFNLWRRYGSSAHWTARRATWLEVSSVLLLGLALVFHQRVPQVFRYSAYYWLPVSALIYVFAHQAGALSRWLSTRPLVILGEISFAFYLVHQLIIRYFRGVNRRLYDFGEGWFQLVVILLLSLAVSYVLYRYFEKPLNRFIRRRWS